MLLLRQARRARLDARVLPGDRGHFNLLAADVDGALSALRARRDADRRRIGMVGGSQAGWIVPLAAARFEHALASTAMVDAPAISYGEEQLYSKLTGEEGGMPSGLSSEEIDQGLDEAGARRALARGPTSGG